AVVCEDGLAIWRDGIAFACAWPDTWFVGTPTALTADAASRGFTLRTAAERSFYFDDDNWTRFPELRTSAYQAVETRAWPRRVAALQAGQDIDFGDLTVIPTGLRKGTEVLTWQQITGLARGKDAVHIRSGQLTWAKVDLSY